MKKKNLLYVLIFVLFLAMLLAFCNGREETFYIDDTQPRMETIDPMEDASSEPVESLPEETESTVTEPTVTEPPAPETIPGTALADRTAIILMMVNRDSVVNVVGEFDDDHYIVQTELGYGLIEKRLVRMDGEAVYEQWTGYAAYGAILYNNYHLFSAEHQELAMNTQVQVLDDLGEVYVVQFGDTVGYMRESQINRSYIQPYSGGSSDGGDISLRYQGSITSLSLIAPQSGEVTGSATVLVNDGHIILGWYDRGETVNIVTEAGFVEEKDGFCIVYLDGFCGYVQQPLIAQEGTQPYAEWDGYARSKAGVFDNYYLTGNPQQQLSLNSVVHVVNDLGDCYLVAIGDEYGYMSKDQLSETYIVYNGGGTNEWSDPVM